MRKEEVPPLNIQGTLEQATNEWRTTDDIAERSLLTFVIDALTRLAKHRDIKADQVTYASFAQPTTFKEDHRRRP